MRARCFTFTYWSCFNFFLGLSRYTMRPVHTDVYFCVILHNECLLNKEEKLWMMKRLNNIYISLFTLMRYPLYHMYIQWYENKKYEKIKLYCCLDEIGMYSIKAPDPNTNTIFTKEYSSQGCALWCSVAPEQLLLPLDGKELLCWAPWVS